ncbi:indoleamine 2,3-dioxygenase 2-like [Tubulanus polymorphus]|uniref:indoleamine 2,3-dioxygenase 2-like n=1 Tax=Tubulanus polymorphus TaxID=672921 RepID=UPI003DA1E93B
MDLSTYFIDEEYGFLLSNPLTVLPKPYQIWVEFARNIVQQLENHELRRSIRQLPLISEDAGLQSYKQLRLGRMCLIFIVSAYMWQEGDEHAIEVIPMNLAIPLYNISKRLGLKPIISHADCVLANWQKIDPTGPFEFSNLKTILQFPGGRSFDSFVLLTAEIEMGFCPGIKAIVKALENVENENIDELIGNLNIMREVIQVTADCIFRLHDECDPHVFYNEIRPFLGGYGGDNSPFPDGVVFEGVSDEKFKLSGGSAAQSSSMQCFDEALGIHIQPEKKNFLIEMRNYMPPAHKSFIEALARAPSIRQFVERAENERLINAYNGTVAELKQFRDSHIKLVARYIVCMSNKAKRSAGVRYQAIEKTGTGGQSPMQFLKSIRNSTSSSQLSNT